MSTKYAAINTWLYVSLDNTVWHKVAACQDFAGPKLSKDTIDVTTHDVTDDYKEYIGSLKDSKDISFSLVMDPNDASQNEVNPYGLKALFETGFASTNTPYWKLVWPVSPAARLAFRGIVTGYEFAAKIKDALMVSATVKVTGASAMEAGGIPV